MKENRLRKLVLLILISLSVLWINHSVIAGCLAQVAACSNTDDIPPGDECSNYFVYFDSVPAYTVTYCSDCGVCDPGYSDCMQGACGCESCNLPNGNYWPSGYVCTGGTSPGCSDDTSAPYTCED